MLQVADSISRSARRGVPNEHRRVRERKAGEAAEWILKHRAAGLSEVEKLDLLTAAERAYCLNLPTLASMIRDPVMTLGEIFRLTGGNTSLIFGYYRADAAHVTLNSGNVTAWAPREGSGSLGNLTDNANAARRPLWVSNDSVHNQPTVKGDGSSDMLIAGSSFGSTFPIYIRAITRYNTATPSSGQSLWSCGDKYYTTLYNSSPAVSGDSVAAQHTTFNTVVTGVTPLCNLNQWYVHSALYDDAAASKTTKITLGTNTNSGLVTLSVAASQVFSIFARNTPGAPSVYSSASLAEIMILNMIPTAAQEAYFARNELVRYQGLVTG